MQAFFFSVGVTKFSTKISLKDKNNLLVTRNVYAIRDFDIVYVEAPQFDVFVKEFLPRIRSKIVLMTGYWNLPQVYKSRYTDHALNHPNIALWISQNPIYSDHPKYMEFPYGISYYNLPKYSEQLVKREVKKTNLIEHLPLNYVTNPCRNRLPKLDNIEPSEFYEKIAQAKFLISPIGDRDDCYRHYECIGLGTIPISNVGDTYHSIFGDSMYYSNIDNMVKILLDEEIDMEYYRKIQIESEGSLDNFRRTTKGSSEKISLPNRDLVSFDYWKDMVHKRINELHGHTRPSFKRGLFFTSN